MVFEAVFTNLLNTYLNTFIDDLSANQLKIGAFRGDFELKNLAIRGNAFDSLNLPFRVVKGRIGHLSARIPWVSLYTNPVIFNFNEIFIVCVPNPDSKYDPEIEQRLSQADKKKQLQQIEEAMKRSAINNETETNQDDFVTKLLAQIIKNIEIKVNNVHICYEDRFTNPKLPFSIGLTLHSLSFVTRQLKENELQSSNPENCINKLISLENFSLYWNCSYNLQFISDQNDDDATKLFYDAIATDSMTPSHLNYILAPNNFKAFAFINRKPKEDNFTVPMFNIATLLDQFSLSFNRKQFESLLKLLDSFNRMKVAQHYRKWRPSKGIHGNAKEWWHFAYKSILESDIKRRNRNWSWKHIKEHRKLLHDYKKLYKEKLLNPKSKDTTKLNELEEKLDVFNIVLVRSQVNLEISKEIKQEVKEENKGWFSWMWGSSKKDKSEEGTIIEEIKKEITPEEKAKLFQAIGYEEGLPPQYPLSYIAYAISLNIKKISMVVNDEIGKCLVTFSLKDLTSSFGYKPASSGLNLSFKIKDISMLGCNENSMIDKIYNNQDLIEASIEINPTDKQFDYGILFKTRGVNFIFHSQTVNRLFSLIIPPSDVSLDQLQALAEIRLEKFKMMSATGLEYAINQHKKLSIDALIEPSFIVVPDHGELSACKDLLILSLGQIKVFSDPSNKTSVKDISPTERESLIYELRQSAYEKYIFSISQIQIILSSSKEWKTKCNTIDIGNDSNHLLDPFSISFLFYRSIILDDPEMPKIKLEGDIPKIIFKANTSQLIHLFNLGLSIPLPKSNEVPKTKKNSLTEAKVTKDALKFVHENVIKEETKERDFQMTNIVASFKIDSIVCDLRTDENKELLIFKVRNIGASMYLKTYDMSIRLYLGHISVDAFDEKCRNVGIAFKLVQTLENEDLLECKYEYIEQSSPNFKGISSKAQAQLSQVKCAIDKSILDELLKYGNSVKVYLPEKQKQVHVPEKLTRKNLSASAMSLSKLGIVKKKKKTDETDGIDIISFGANLMIGKVVITICDISSTTFEGLECNVSLKESGIIFFRAKWNNFIVANTLKFNNEECLIYPNIVKSESDKVLEIETVLYPEGLNSENDLDVKIHFGRLKIVYLNIFYMRLIDFMTVFSAAKQTAIEAGAAAADFAKARAMNAYENAYKIKLDIMLSAPIIVIPRNYNTYIGLLIDLGHIGIKNRFKEKGKTLLDNYICELSNTKISMIKDSNLVDDLLQPISFKVELNRNLTYDIIKPEPEIAILAKLEDIRLKVSQVDISTFFKILEENISVANVATTNEEISTQMTVVEIENIQKQKAIMTTAIIEEAIVHAEVDKVIQRPVNDRYNFKFTLTKVDALLYDGEIKNNSTKFTEAYLDHFEFNFSMFTDDSKCGWIEIKDIVLCDVREGRKPTGIKKLLYSIEDDLQDVKMAKINFQMKQDIIINVDMTGFTLVFALDYLVQLSNILTASLTGADKKEEIQSEKVPKKKYDKPKDTKDKTNIESLVIGKFKMTRADIVLIESIDNSNSPAVILNNLLDIGFKMKGEVISIDGGATNINLGLTNYDKYHSIHKVDSYILKPFDIYFIAKLSGTDCQHIFIDFTEISLHISPNTVQILTSILGTLGSSQVESTNKLEGKYLSDEGNIFKPKKIDSKKYWFMTPKVSLAEEATEDMSEECETDPAHVTSRQLIMKIPSVTIIIESGGIDSKPLIKLNSSHSIIFNNWNVLSLCSSCYMDYYNERKFFWEPIIEKLDSEDFSFDLKIHIIKDEESNSYRYTSFLESKQQLELTISKSAIEVINKLASSFSTAVKQTDVLKIDENLLYFYNFMGMKLILFVDPKKMLHSKKGVTREDGLEAIELQPCEEFIMKSITNENNDSDTNITFEIHHLDEKITSSLSLTDIEKKCYNFPLLTYTIGPSNEYKWVLDMTRRDASTKRFIFGSLIEIHNHFSSPMCLFYPDEDGNFTFLYEIDAFSFYYVPVDIVYSEFQCIFVRPKGEWQIPENNICWKHKEIRGLTSFLNTIICHSEKDETDFYIQVKFSLQYYDFEDPNEPNTECVGFKFEIMPSAKLRNLLPVPISYLTTNKGVNLNRMTKIMPGGTCDMHNLNLQSTMVYISVDDYLEQSWTCLLRFPLKWTKEDQIEVHTFASINDPTNTMDLAIDYNKKDDLTRIASLFSPFWMINKTGLELCYKIDDYFVRHPSDGDFIFLCFKSKALFSKKKISLAIADSKFSDSFSIDAVGNKGTIYAKGKNKNYCASIDIELSSFGITKVVTVSPFYFVINRSNIDLEVSENLETWTVIKSRSSESLWPKYTNECLLYFRIINFGNNQESKPISLKDSGVVLLQIKDRLIYVNIEISDSSVVVSCSNYFKGAAPVRIFNSLPDLTVDYGQVYVAHRSRLPPMSSAYFTWLDPTKSPLNLIWSTTISEETLVDLSHDTLAETEQGQLLWATFMDGKQRILLITRDQDIAKESIQRGELIKPTLGIEVVLKGVGISLVNNEKRKEIAYISITSSDIIWEVCRQRGKRYQPLSVKHIELLENAYQKVITRLQVSDTLKISKGEQNLGVFILDNLKVNFNNIKDIRLLEPVKGYLRRSAAPGVWFTLGMSKLVFHFHTKINRIQIDNQMNDCIFGIVMCPVTPPRSLALDYQPKAFLECSAIMQRQVNLVRFKYVTLLIQEYLIQIDGDFLMALSELISFKTKKSADYEKLVKETLDNALKDQIDYQNYEFASSLKNYYDLIHFSPIKVHVSFNIGSADSFQLFGIFDFLIKSAGITLTEFKDVILRIDYFERKNVLLSNKEIVSLVTSHYIRQVLKQIYVVMLGLDVLGNPVGLLMGFKQGVGDFFYEPFMGFIEGPEEFAEGLSLGIRSLFSHTVGGAAGALGKITGTIADGISTLTMDQESRRKRRERMNKRSTFAESGKNLARGFFGGITGLVTKPMKGAKKEGFEGLLKGFSRGVIGVVADPATGVIDFASGSLNALQRAVDINKEAKKQRLPRNFSHDGVLRSYNKYEATGLSILNDLNKGHRDHNDHYIAHAYLTNDTVFLITDERVLYLKTSCLSKNLEIEWEEMNENIKELKIMNSTDLIILIKVGSRGCGKICDLFKCSFQDQRRKLRSLVGDEPARLISCPTMHVAKWLLDKFGESKLIKLR